MPLSHVALSFLSCFLLISLLFSLLEVPFLEWASYFLRGFWVRQGGRILIFCGFSLAFTEQQGKEGRGTFQNLLKSSESHYLVTRLPSSLDHALHEVLSRTFFSCLHLSLLSLSSFLSCGLVLSFFFFGDFARLSQRYPHIARYGVLVSQHDHLGAMPPHNRGISAILVR